MEQLDVDGGFDVHDYRSDLKLERQGGDSTALTNRGDLRCPGCGRPFARLLVTEDDRVTFGSAPGGPICVVRTEGELLILEH